MHTRPLFARGTLINWPFFGTCQEASATIPRLVAQLPKTAAATSIHKRRTWLLARLGTKAKGGFRRSRTYDLPTESSIDSTASAAPDPLVSVLCCDHLPGLIIGMETTIFPSPVSPPKPQSQCGEIDFFLLLDHALSVFWVDGGRGGGPSLYCITCKCHVPQPSRACASSLPDTGTLGANEHPTPRSLFRQSFCNSLRLWGRQKTLGAIYSGQAPGSGRRTCLYLCNFDSLLLSPIPSPLAPRPGPSLLQDQARSVIYIRIRTGKCGLAVDRVSASYIRCLRIDIRTHAHI